LFALLGYQMKHTQHQATNTSLTSLHSAKMWATSRAAQDALRRQGVNPKTHHASNTFVVLPFSEFDEPQAVLQPEI
jgi:hypothetical protein